MKMKMGDRKRFEMILSNRIMEKTGVFTNIEVRRNYAAIRPYEKIIIECFPKNEEQFSKEINISCQTIYDTEWNDIADRIINHLYDERNTA